MRSLALISIVLLTACGCSSAPTLDDTMDQLAGDLAGMSETLAPKPTEYPVPLIFSDGHIEQIIVEDSKPEEGVRMIFCKDMPAQIVCLASVNGRSEWMSVPKAAEGNQAT